jgi:ribonuclease BN (tRNA processing enzyme)
MLIDCGATSLVGLKRDAIDPAEIGLVAITHLHGDHFGGIPWLILDGQFAGRVKPLIVAGPPGTEERLARTFEALYPGATATERRFETSVIELAERRATVVGPAVITPFEVRHGGGAPPYALRVQYGGKIITYSGDTEWTDSLLEAADRADLFVCECNFFDTRAPGHLDYQTVLSRRDELTCRHLVLTHLSDQMLDRLEDVEIDAAYDGAVITL